MSKRIKHSTNPDIRCLQAQIDELRLELTVVHSGIRAILKRGQGLRATEIDAMVGTGEAESIEVSDAPVEGNDVPDEPLGKYGVHTDIREAIEETDHDQVAVSVVSDVAQELAPDPFALKHMGYGYYQVADAEGKELLAKALKKPEATAKLGEMLKSTAA